MRFPKPLRVVAVLTLLLASGSAGFYVWAKDKYVVPILMYHQVAVPSSKHQLNVVSPQSFARQMEFLKKNKYAVISFQELAEGIQAGKSFQRNSVVLTFDDGYLDNYTQAFPVLQKHGFPAIVFTVSDFVNTDGYVTWEQLKTMDDAGFKVGSHTRRHAYLPDIKDRAVLEDEILNSKRILETYMGRPIEFFSYPVGGLNHEIMDVVKQAGYKAAAATNRGTDKLNRDVYQLNRMRIKDSDSDLVFWVKTSGYYNLFRRPKPY
jgi:peptidoglycan/xylan/chitin deacetylase (PgdA/CDA1 family)